MSAPAAAVELRQRMDGGVPGWHLVLLAGAALGRWLGAPVVLVPPAACECFCGANSRDRFVDICFGIFVGLAAAGGGAVAWRARHRVFRNFLQYVGRQPARPDLARRA